MHTYSRTNEIQKNNKQTIYNDTKSLINSAIINVEYGFQISN